MKTCVYDTMPQKSGEKRRHFEIKQRMSAAPLTKRPKTGEAIRRVVLGGYGVRKSGGSAEEPKSSEGNCCCGPSGCCD